MTKRQLKDKVVMGFFSLRWLKNDGSERYLHRCILGTHKRIAGEHKEHYNYVLVYKIGNGYGEQRRWANVNPNTITHINNEGVA